MIKRIIGVGTILIASGVWFYLDLLNKQELAGAALVHDSVESARAEVKKRAKIKENFENLTLIYLNHCQVAAETAKTDFMDLLEKAVPPVKKGKTEVPQLALAEAEKIHETAKAVCQRIYESRLNDGV